MGIFCIKFAIFSCVGEPINSESCQPEETCCKTENGGWSDYSDWGPCFCNHTDGTGAMTRTRECTNPTLSCDGRYLKILAFSCGKI